MSGHDIAVRGGGGDHGGHEGHGMATHMVRHPILMGTVVVVPVPPVLPGVVEVVGVHRAGLQLGESLVVHMLRCIVEVGHGGYGVHRCRHGGRGNGLGFLDAGGRELVRRVVVRYVREDKGPVHRPPNLLLWESLVAVAAADGVARVGAPATALLTGHLVLHLPAKHALVG